ncbi:MAG: hypothetical protein JWN44_5568 [Myxococcales bacterium]|nr:hypothetical protein [Myxococcales bacterium]
MRILIVAGLLATTPALAQSVSVTVGAPPPPRVIVTSPAPPPPRAVFVPPPPVIRYEAPPPLVVVEPGVQVVEDADEEVFFVDGYYWHPGANGWWYRTRSYRGGWVAVPARSAPPRLVRLPPGQYRHWRAEKRMDHEVRKEERREDREQRHDNRREEKSERKWEKHHDKH